MGFTLRDAIMVLALVLLAAALALSLYKIWRAKHQTDESLRRGVSRHLRKYAALRGFQVLDAPRFLVGGQAGGADHIMVGHFGVLLVYDLCTQGDYYGGVNDKKWTVNTEDGARREVVNPFPLAQACAGRVNLLLRENGLPLPPVERVAVVIGERKKVNIAIKSDEIVLEDGLGRYLAKAKFDQDRDVDVEKVAEALRAAQVKEV